MGKRLASPTSFHLNSILLRHSYSSFRSVRHPLSSAVLSIHIFVCARMISRTALSRSSQRVAQCPSLRHRGRGLATAASGSFTYQTGNAAGVKIASRDLPGPTTHLAVVAKAGTRYEVLPGFSDGLEKFAFKNTERRTALRIVRETELLGGELSAHHSRENLVLSTKFLRDDLPYFAELLAEVTAHTKFSRKHSPTHRRTIADPVNSS